MSAFILRKKRNETDFIYGNFRERYKMIWRLEVPGDEEARQGDQFLKDKGKKSGLLLLKNQEIVVFITNSFLFLQRFNLRKVVFFTQIQQSVSAIGLITRDATVFANHIAAVKGGQHIRRHPFGAVVFIILYICMMPGIRFPIKIFFQETLNCMMKGYLGYLLDILYRERRKKNENDAEQQWENLPPFKAVHYGACEYGG